MRIGFSSFSPVWSTDLSESMTDVGSSSASLVDGAEQAPWNKAAIQTATTNKIWCSSHFYIQ
jgi:hypothetical protein